MSVNECQFMKTFHCTACQALVFFENTRCLSCGRSLAYLSAGNEIAALEQSENGAWHVVRGDNVSKESYQLCSNYVQHDVCNWALAPGSTGLCQACGLTHTIPDLG